LNSCISIACSIAVPVLPGPNPGGPGGIIPGAGGIIIPGAGGIIPGAGGIIIGLPPGTPTPGCIMTGIPGASPPNWLCIITIGLYSGGIASGGAGGNPGAAVSVAVAGPQAAAGVPILQLAQRRSSR
jgi:hypothetical protein